MTLYFNNDSINQLGYFAVFFLLSFGFVFLKIIDRKDVGPGYWAASFIFNALGFLSWATTAPGILMSRYLLGEVLHITGFLLLIIGAYRYAGYAYRKWNIVALLAWLALWAIGLYATSHNGKLAAILLKGARGVLFCFGGVVLLKSAGRSHLKGQLLAGYCLLLWAAAVGAYAFINVGELAGLAFGTLVGIQLLSAFGMMIMVVEGILTKAEHDQRHIQKLEGLLPICCHCKKIRDKQGNWEILESYIERRTKAEFSHGVCPECLEKHYTKYL